LGSEDGKTSWSEIVMGTGKKLNRYFYVFCRIFDVGVGRIAFEYFF
jgi:hypothetical protein